MDDPVRFCLAMLGLVKGPHAVAAIPGLGPMWGQVPTAIRQRNSPLSQGSAIYRRSSAPAEKRVRILVNDCGAMKPIANGWLDPNHCSIGARQIGLGPEVKWGWVPSSLVHLLILFEDCAGINNSRSRSSATQA
jgi:hypothetical protein